MLTDAAIREIVSLTEEAKGRLLTDKMGREFSSTPVHDLPRDPMVGTLKLNTLDGLCNFIVHHLDNYPTRLAGCLVHVVDAQDVRFFGPLDAWNRRPCIAQAACEDMGEKLLRAGGFPLKEAIINIQTICLQTSARADLLRVLGNVVESAEVQTEDDGVTQKVTTRKGRVLKDADGTPIPSPLALQVWRTFREVVQPEMELVLRMEEGPRVRLIGSDGNSWVLDAVDAIESYVRKMLRDSSADGITIIG
jgi:hypothetical protein